jgi:TetR/AcrR family transcriptional regulator
MPDKTSTKRLSTQARQAEIVAAALRLAETNSPAAITTTDLADAVGLSQGALFKHFPGKEAVWFAAMQWLVEELMSTLKQAAQSAKSPLAALQCVFEAHAAFVSRHPGVPRLVFHVLQQPDLPDLAQQARSLMQGYRAMIQELLRQAIVRGDADADLDLGAAATMFLGLMQGLTMQSQISGQMATMPDQAPAVFELYRRALRKQP